MAEAAADSVLIEAAINGDQTSFAELVRRYQAAVWGTVHRTLGNSSEREDAVQEVFLRALVSLPRFDRRYPFGPWILRIASNYCIDQLRRRKARKYRLWSDLSESEEGDVLKAMCTRPDSLNLAPEDYERHLEVARSLLERLKPKLRMAFVLREVEGRRYDDVAAILGISEITARVRVSRARGDLQRAFRRHLSAVEREVANEEHVRVV